ncbi:MAG: hypothetical protein U0836_07210 [Pirellulales bacterium]
MVAYCPERIVQGFALEELGKLPQIVGGVTPEATDRAAELFGRLGVEVVVTTPVEAELAKLFANAHRYVTFALSNQFFLIAEKFGANFVRVREAVTAQYPRLAGFAGAGFAGGPCLLKDTMQLGAFNHNSFAARPGRHDGERGAAASGGRPGEGPPRPVAQHGRDPRHGLQRR